MVLCVADSWVTRDTETSSCTQLEDELDNQVITRAQPSHHTAAAHPAGNTLEEAAKEIVEETVQEKRKDIGDEFYGEEPGSVVTVTGSIIAVTADQLTASCGQLQLPVTCVSFEAGVLEAGAAPAPPSPVFCPAPAPAPAPGQLVTGAAPEDAGGHLASNNIFQEDLSGGQQEPGGKQRPPCNINTKQRHNPKHL